MGETVRGGLYKVGEKYVDADGREIDPPPGTIPSTVMGQLEKTAEGKIVLFNTSTGERIERWPVDAKGMLAHGEYSATPVDVARNVGNDSTERRTRSSLAPDTDAEAFPAVLSLGTNEIGPGVRRRSELAIPEQVTLDWLIRHVPIKIWGSAIGVLLAAFLLGIAIGASFPGPLEIIR